MAGDNITDIAISCEWAQTIAGKVTDSPIPFAEVTVELESKTFTTSADANGEYSLLLTTSNEQEMVTAIARGRDGQEFVRFVNLLGSFGSVQAAADGNGVTAANVTNVTTARYALVVRANLGTAPESEQALMRVERNVDANELLDLAAAIKLIVDDPAFVLPPGFAHVLDFAQDSGAVNDFIAAAQILGASFAQARDAILADPDLSPGITPDKLASAYYVVPASAPGMFARVGEKIEFNADGTGTMLANLSDYMHDSARFDFLWSVSDGVIQFDYTGAVLDAQSQRESSLHLGALGTMGIATPDERSKLLASGITAVRYQVVPVTANMRFVSPGAGTSFVEFKRKSRWVFESVELNDGEILKFDDHYPAETTEYTQAWAEHALPKLAFTPEMVIGEWAIYLFLEHMLEVAPNPVVRRDFVAEFVNLGVDGTVTGNPTLGAMHWRITEAGELEVAYGGGWAIRYRIVEQNGPALAVFMEALHGADARYGNFGFIVRSDPTLDVTGDFLVTEHDELWRKYTDIWRASMWDHAGPPAPPELGAGSYAYRGYILNADGTYSYPFYAVDQGVVGRGISGLGDWSFDGEGRVIFNSGPSGSEEIDFEWRALNTDSNGFLYVIDDEVRTVGPRVRRIHPPRIGVMRKEPNPLP